MQSKNRFVVGTAALALVGFSVSAIVGWNSHERGSLSMAAWAFPLGGEHLIRDVDQIVVAKPVGVHPGREVVSESGDHSMQFEVVELQVIAGLKGASEGDTIFVERASAIVEGAHVSPIVIDGGPMTNGAELMFLKNQPEGSFLYIVNDLSRYTVSERGDLRPAGGVDADLARGSFAGKTVAEVDAMVKVALSK